MCSNPHVLSFLSESEELYADIEQWLAGTELKTHREATSINEEASGQYLANRLIIEDEAGKKIADVSPVAAFVIAADGRLDMNGTVGKANIVHLQQGGPSITTTIHAGSQTESSTRYMYKGVDKSGWYMIDNSLNAKAHFIDKIQFFKLLDEVSDYEQQSVCSPLDIISGNA